MEELPVLPSVPRTRPLGENAPPPWGEKPPWVRTKFSHGPGYLELKRLMRELGLHTICEEGRCPNITECWENRTATFMLLGEVCTRNCGFCNVATGRPGPVDWDEPARLAEAVARLGLRHIVVTSVTRDDLTDGGGAVFAMTIRELRRRAPSATIEVLVPDFRGNWKALELVMAARPDILNHNLETVPRLYGRVRPKAVYQRSLELLSQAKELDSSVLTKSGLMVGLGETWSELFQVFSDLRAHRVDILTVGQYLRPTLRHLPVERYYTPAEFDQLRRMASAMGFRHVESGPLVRSSYHAHQQACSATDLPPPPATI